MRAIVRESPPYGCEFLSTRGPVVALSRHPWALHSLPATGLLHVPLIDDRGETGTNKGITAVWTDMVMPGHCQLGSAEFSSSLLGR